METNRIAHLMPESAHQPPPVPALLPLGRFRIRLALILEDYQRLHPWLNRMVVIRADAINNGDGIDWIYYTGIHPTFELVDPMSADPPPIYEPTTQTSKITKTLITAWERLADDQIVEMPPNSDAAEEFVDETDDRT